MAVDTEEARRTAGVPARRWLVIAGVAAAVAVAVYLLAVCTATGQALENAALRGADQADAAESAQAWRALDEITVYSLAAATLVIALTGALRRRWDLAVAAAGVIVLGQVVVQVLKRFVLVRPALVPVTGDFAGNSLPSGHTTVAMTVLFAAVIVAPYRWRGAVMLVVLPWAVGIGQYTLTAKWHRLSDTLAADAIALALAALASWWLARRGAVRPYEGKRRVGRVVIGSLAVVAALAGLTLGGILWGVPLAREGLTGADEWVIHLGAGSFASAGSIVAALVFLLSWRRLAT
ncbi:phosphatase PAP2 family protein [Amycolatopsis thermalba]|uniref:phosphatase PAP2 family protein n=1 Tax=Amycolatopsis thermalba TaxID=944492 RepID=UPI000E275638|nr:phosphatase PAP2 family protein [Amycolatopsis thermalba]